MSWGTNWARLAQLAREGIEAIGETPTEGQQMDRVKAQMHGMTEGEAAWHKRWVQAIADINTVRETLDALGVPKGKVPYILQSDEGPDVDLSWRLAWLLGRQAGRVAEEEREAAVWVNGGRVLGLTDVRRAPETTAALNEGEVVLAREENAAHWQKVATTALRDLTAVQEAHRQALQVANRLLDVAKDATSKNDPQDAAVYEFVDITKGEYPDVFAAMADQRLAVNAYPEPFDESGPLDDPVTVDEQGAG